MNSESGFSIFETFIALLITMIMTAGLLKIFMNSRTVNMLENNFTDLQENARFTASYLSRIIRLAGYRTPPSNGLDFSNYNTVFPSGTNFIAGTNGTGTNGSDTITIRYQGSGNGTGTPDGTVRDCLNNPVDANTTAINVFSLTPNNELQCQATNPNASPNINTQILVSGVENMQILYGEDVDGNGTADRYVPSDFATLDMTRVVSVRVSLLFQSNDPIEINPVQKTYNLNGTLYTPSNFTYLRTQVNFTSTLRNLIAVPR